MGDDSITAVKSGRMTLNLPKLIKTLGESLYSDPTIAIRELIQNGNDSCVHRESQDPQHPASAIHVRFDPYKRLLTIQDNGSGMTWEEAEEFLTVIGNSRTEQVREYLSSINRLDLANRLIGKFGLGLLSAFMIGERVEFLTLSYKPGSKPVWWECDGGHDYRIAYSNEPAPVGTAVTVHVGARYIGLLNETELTRLIRLFGDLLQVPIFLDPLTEPVNASAAPWDHEQPTEAEYEVFLRQRFPYDEPLEIIPIHVEQDEGEFQVKGVLFIPKQAMFIVQEYGDVILYVRRMLIKRDERELLPPWARFVRGIIDTPSLNEQTSRGAVAQDGDFERVQQVLGNAILTHLQDLAVNHSARLKEVVTAHNVVIKAWSLVSEELFDCVKDLVLFSTEGGRVNLARYFQMSQSAESELIKDSGKRFIFYFTTPGGAGPHSILFSARGLQVIDASRFPDEAFLRKYAHQHPDVEARSLDIAGGFIFEDPAGDKNNWFALEQAYEKEQISAQVVQFQPADIPAVLIFPESKPLTEQVDTLLNDPGLSDTIKDLIRRMYSERESSRKKSLGVGTLYVNSKNPIVQSLSTSDISDPEMREVIFAIYHNALMLSSQGAKNSLPPGTARSVFEANTRTIASLMSKIREVRELKAQAKSPSSAKGSAPQLSAPVAAAPSAMPKTEHVTCFVAIPFTNTYQVVIEALRDVLEVSPYNWQVVRADQQNLERKVSANVSAWIARAHCYAVDITEMRGNVMMELGHAYWGFEDRPLIILQRQDAEPDLIDLADTRRMYYPWGETPDQAKIAAELRKQIEATDELSKLRQPGTPRFLSTRLMREAGVSDKVADTVARRCRTVEDFLKEEPAKIAAELKLAAKLVESLQDFVRTST